MPGRTPRFIFSLCLGVFAVKKLRIGLVIYGSLDTVSGGYLYDRELVTHLRRAGDTVEIISMPWRNYARHLLDNFSSKIFRQLVESSFDVLLQDELNHPSLAFLNPRLRATTRTPIISIVHHLRCYEVNPRLLDAIYRHIERRYLASVDGFIFNSPTTGDAVSDVLGATPARSIVAYPAGNRFDPDITHAEIESRARQSHALRIVFVGNLIARKGLHVLLDALATLPRENFELTAVGNPNVDARYARAIQTQIARLGLTNVRLLGKLDDAALAHTLAQSDVLAVPSEYEGFGIVYLEAMSFGLPAIASTSGAAREIIADRKNGFLVAPNDADMLTVRLSELHRDRARLARMSRAARERFLAHPTWDVSMAHVREWLKSSSL